MESRRPQHGTPSAHKQEISEIKTGSEEFVESQRTTQRNVPTILSIWLRQMRRDATIALLLACLLAGVNIFYHYSDYANYQPARCLIQSEQVDFIQPSGSDHSSPYYEPDINYQIVSPLHIDPDTYLGLTGPGYVQMQMSTSDEAQAFLKRYQPGNVYPCWYSSFGFQRSAVLILQPFVWWEKVFMSVGLFTFAFGFCLIIVMLISFISRIRHLRKKGVFTTGTVGKKYIEFETFPHSKEKIKVPYLRLFYAFGLKGEVRIVYDPQDPQHNFHLANAFTGQEPMAWCFLVFLIPLFCIFLVVLMAV